MLTEILYTIYVEDDKKAEKILDFFNDVNYFESGLSHCRSDWDDDGVLVWASVTEDWRESTAIKAIKQLMKANHLDYQDIEAEFTL